MPYIYNSMVMGDALDELSMYGLRRSLPKPIDLAVMYMYSSP